MAVLLTAHSQGFCQLSAYAVGLLTGGVDGGEPFPQQGDIGFPGVQCSDVPFQLFPDECGGSVLAGGVHQHQQVVIAAHFHDIREVFHHGFGIAHCQAGEDHPEHPSFPQAAADVAGVECGFQGNIAAFGPGAEKSDGDLLVIRLAQRADGGKQIEAVAHGRSIGFRSVFGQGFVGL